MLPSIISNNPSSHHSQAYSKTAQTDFNGRLADNITVQINSLEFIMVILQYATTMVGLETMSEHVLAGIFPVGTPAQPVLLYRMDNTAAEARANKVTSQSSPGQRLIGVLAELLCTKI